MTTTTTVEPIWHRRLRARVREIFPGASSEKQAAYRAAITVLVTLSTSSLDLDEAERMGFDATLNDVEHGICLIRMLDSGQVEICRNGWCYQVRINPLKVTTVLEAD